MKFAHVFVAIVVCICAIWLHDHWRVSTDVLKQPRLAEWAEAGQYFNYRGMPIFYRDSAPNSTKPLILLLHGYPSSSFDWHKLWPMFEHGEFRVVAPDFLGFGFSAKPQYIKYSLVRQANVVEALMKSLSVSAAAEVHVIAHDYAVSVVQELLARDKEFKDRPFRLRSVVFLNGGLFPEAHRPLLVQKLAASPYTGWLIKRLISPTTFRLSFNKVFGPQTQLTEQESLEYWSLLVHNDGHLITDKLLSYIEERRENRRRWVSVLRSTEASLILVNGPADPVSGQHLADRFVKYLKKSHAEVSSLDSHIGHYPQLEAPEATFRHIQTFYTFLPHNKI